MPDEKELAEQRIITEVVNRLIKESFGKGFYGNRYLSSCGGEFGGHLLVVDTPCHIIKIRPDIVWVHNYVGLGSRKFAGQFMEPDGSVIEVISRYEPQAREYAALFQQETGRAAGVEIMKTLDLIVVPHPTIADAVNRAGGLVGCKKR